MLAEKPYESESYDYQYLQGCNLLHKHEYAQALEIFSKTAVLCDVPYTKEILTFNKAFAAFKLND